MSNTSSTPSNEEQALPSYSPIEAPPSYAPNLMNTPCVSAGLPKKGLKQAINRRKDGTTYWAWFSFMDSY